MYDEEGRREKPDARNRKPNNAKEKEMCGEQWNVRRNTRQVQFGGFGE
jgi:hypothetical protein